MRDDVNYRQRAEVTRKILMESLSVSDFARHRSEYNWVNTQKQLLNKGELPKDRKQFLDSILPKWDYDTDVLLDSMHALKVKELYNWTKIAQDTHFSYQKAICETMAERQRKQMEQEKAKKNKKITKESEVTNLLTFRKREAYA